jgi:hypothetical protein
MLRSLRSRRLEPHAEEPAQQASRSNPSNNAYNTTHPVNVLSTIGFRHHLTLEQLARSDSSLSNTPGLILPAPKTAEGQAMQFNFPATTTPAIARIEERRAALADVCARPAIGRADVQHLRRVVFEDGIVGRQEAECLFALERRLTPDCAEWRDFFIEAIVDHLLCQTRPSAVLNEEKAEWLIAQADGTRSFSAFAILVTVLDEAQRVPRWFAPAVRGRAQKGWPGLAAVAAA